MDQADQYTGQTSRGIQASNRNSVASNIKATYTSPTSVAVTTVVGNI
jgi:hypothetical protein